MVSTYSIPKTPFASNNVINFPAPAAKPVYNMGKATPTHAVPEAARAALAKSAGKAGSHPYVDNIAGIEAVRQSVANYINATSSNTKTKAEDVVITNGAVGGTSLVVALQRRKFPESSVLIPAPYYNIYNHMMYPKGQNLVPLQTTKASRFLVTPEELQNAFKWNPGIKTVIIDSGPTNPSGSMYSLAEVQALLATMEEIAATHPDVHFLVDEVVKGLEYLGKTHYSLYDLASPKLKQNMSLAHSASKLGSMAYDRVGAIVSENQKFIKELTEFKMGFEMATNEPAQWGYAALLDDFTKNPATLRAIADDYQAKSEYVMARLDRIGATLYPNREKEILPVRPDGMFIMWADFSGLLGKEVPAELRSSFDKARIESSQDIADLLKAQGVIASAGPNFNKPGNNEANGFLRFSAPLSMDQLEKAMNIVENTVNRVLGRESSIAALPSPTPQAVSVASQMSQVEQSLFNRLGIRLSDNLASPLGLYVPSKISGSQIHLSGTLPHESITGGTMTGCVADETLRKSKPAPQNGVPFVSEEYAAHAARNAAIEVLSILKRDLAKVDKTLDDIDGIQTLNVFVNTAGSGFKNHAKVANGASEVFDAAFGSEKGRAARAAVGQASLPAGAVVEIGSSFNLKEREVGKAFLGR